MYIHASIYIILLAAHMLLIIHRVQCSFVLTYLVLFNHLLEGGYENVVHKGSSGAVVFLVLKHVHNRLMISIYIHVLRVLVDEKYFCTTAVLFSTVHNNYVDLTKF